VAVRRPAQGAPGQHFLRSSRLAATLVREAGIRPGDLVVEVGAGAGALTRPLVETGARVIALELDPDLAGRLARSEAARGVEVVETDVLVWQWPDREFAVVANLPFARSSAILTHLLSDPRSPLRRADLIVQWELAVKQTATSPATLKSIYWRSWYDLVLARRLSRTAFSPVPSVDAAVLRIARRAEPLVPAHEHRAYWRFLSEAFGARGPHGRLGPAVSRIEVKRLAPVLGFDPAAHPRDLDAHQWSALFAATRRGRRDYVRWK
jgi:23S rRNA (adenine-N6)-dimethyltransferase